jgi:hypothetical protein
MYNALNESLDIETFFGAPSGSHSSSLAEGRDAMVSKSPIRCSFGRASACALTALCLLPGLCAAGEPVAKTEQDTIAWGEEVRGLQAGVRILSGEDGKPHEGPYRFGDEVRLEFRLRNVSKKFIKVEEFHPFPLVVAANEDTFYYFWSANDARPVSTSIRVLWPNTDFAAAEQRIVIGAPGGPVCTRSATRSCLDLDSGNTRIALRHDAPFMDKESWRGRITSGEVSIETTDDPDARKKGAIRLLERGLNSFELELRYWGGEEARKKPMLHLNIEDKSHGKGPQEKNGNKTFFRITPEQAKSVIGFLGTTDFYPEALKKKPAWVDKTKSEPQLVLSVSVGLGARTSGDRESVQLSMPVSVETAVKHIGELQALLGEDSAAHLDAAIKDFTAQAEAAK